jgi:ABC-type lipoprotein export system ATPase subunit
VDRTLDAIDQSTRVVSSPRVKPFEPDVIIDLDDVFVLYRGTPHDIAALRGLSIQIRQGERVVIHGPSGAGKSTFVKLITAAITPNAGTALLFDRELSILDHGARTALRRESIGIITQHSGDDLAAELTCEQNVALQPRTAEMSRLERREATADALRAVGATHLAHRRPNGLSHGEIQRVGIAVAVAHRPRLIVADEPTGQLDVTNADAMLDVLDALATETGATLVIATHDEAAARLADRVLTIADGRLSEERRRGDARPSAVVDERGWLRIPQHARQHARIGGRVTFTEVDNALVVTARGGDSGAAHVDRPAPVQRAASVSDVSTKSRREPAVRTLRDVTKSFGDVEVLEGVSLHIERGLTALVGRSGSGKSTLLSILSGYLPPTSGAVESPAGAVDVSVCPAVPAFPDGLTAREVLDLTVRIQRQEPNPPERDELLKRLGMWDLQDRVTAELSGGERQRLAIARCLIVDAPLMLLDEPTAQLDRRNAQRVTDLLEDAASRAAVVCATHDAELIRQADAVHSLDADQRPVPSDGPVGTIRA